MKSRIKGAATTSAVYLDCGKFETVSKQHPYKAFTIEHSLCCGSAAGAEAVPPVMLGAFDDVAIGVIRGFWGAFECFEIAEN